MFNFSSDFEDDDTQDTKELANFSFVYCKANVFEAKMNQMCEEFDKLEKEVFINISSESDDGFSVCDSDDEDDETRLFFDMELNDGKNNYLQMKDQKIKSSPNSVTINHDSPLPIENKIDFVIENKKVTMPDCENPFLSQSFTPNVLFLIQKARNAYVDENNSYLFMVAKKYSLASSFEEINNNKSKETSEALDLEENKAHSLGENPDETLFFTCSL